MIKVICDKCKRDCDLNAYVLSVEVIHNPVPHNPLSRAEIKLTDDNAFMRMVLCQDCYGKLPFPNIYTVQRTKELDFENKQEAAE